MHASAQAHSDPRCAFPNDGNHRDVNPWCMVPTDWKYVIPRTRSRSGKCKKRRVAAGVGNAKRGVAPGVGDMDPWCVFPDDHPGTLLSPQRGLQTGSIWEPHGVPGNEHSQPPQWVSIWEPHGVPGNVHFQAPKRVSFWVPGNDRFRAPKRCSKQARFGLPNRPVSGSQTGPLQARKRARFGLPNGSVSGSQTGPFRARVSGCLIFNYCTVRVHLKVHVLA